jgi:hypothetical protein
MDITPNYNLIPYPDHDYQLKPYVPENPVRKQDSGPEPIDGHRRFRQPRPNIYTTHLEVPNHTYGVGQSLAYPNIDQVGHLIDIYA